MRTENLFKPVFCKSLLTIGVWLLAACAHESDPLARIAAPDLSQVAEEKLLIVDCLMPGQVRRIGAYAQTVTPRRPQRISVAQCDAAGGEYVAPNTNPRQALKVWLPFAIDGDVDAQVNVGELFERGIEGAPDYASAVQWYERAAAKGSARAAVNLAAMYERGQGVRRDLPKARVLYRQAGGFAPSAERPRIQLIDPPTMLAAIQMRGLETLRVAAAPGPFTLAGRVTAESGLATLSINNEARNVDAKGLFSVTLNLAAAGTPVSIIATDKQGVRTQADFVLEIDRAARAQPTIAASLRNDGRTTRYALVIANQNYKKYEKLSTPLADGDAIKNVLESRFGFEVTLLRDATRRDVLSALAVLRAKASSADQVLVYYAGHGEMDAVTQRGYWVPVDGEQKNNANWISIIDVSDQLAAMQARHVMVIADSCYSGTMTRSAVPEIDQAISEDARRTALDQLNRNRARVAMSSGGLEPVVDGGGGRNSIYARSLIDVLNNLREPVQAQQLHDAVAARFAFLARRLRLDQTPEYAPIRFAGHESGDFVFSPRAL
jgi:uncharacterized protein